MYHGFTVPEIFQERNLLNGNSLPYNIAWYSLMVYGLPYKITWFILMVYGLPYNRTWCTLMVYG